MDNAGRANSLRETRSDKKLKLRRFFCFSGGIGVNDSSSAPSGKETPPVSNSMPVHRTSTGPVSRPGGVSVLRGPLGLEFVPVPRGDFQMGSSTGGSDEYPVHTVIVAEPFQMSRFQVTGGQWKELMGNNPSHFSFDNHLPVESVSWQDAQQFIKRLNSAGRDGYHYRLPTEAEWEYACRAGTSGEFSGDLGEVAWYGANSGGKSHAVGLKKPNAWGLYDMHGNVWEWVEDWYSSSYYLRSPSVDPPGPPAGNFRVIRGGAWIIYRDCCRSAHRDGRWPGSRSYYVGFRVVRTRIEDALTRADEAI